MKVLLCTPYVQNPNVITGGINIWGKNIVQYYAENPSDIDMIPVSFDRKVFIDPTTNVIKRFVTGIKDYKTSISDALAVIDREKINVMHLCTSAQLSLFKDYYLLRKAKEKNVKTAIHFHFGRIPELLKLNNWECKMVLRICKTVDSIVVMDRKSFTALKNRGFDNVFYLPNPLSDDIIDDIEKESGKIERIPNKVIYVGHLIKTKGIYELVEACKDVPNIDLHLIGTYGEEEKNNILSIVGNDAKWLHLRGGIPHSEVIKEMLSAGVFILPSYTEGFPNVILESMAASCAIVATNVGAIPEILDFGRVGECGIELKPRDVLSIKEKLNALMKDTTAIAPLGMKARKKVVETYTMRVVCKQLEDIWKNTAIR